MESIFYQAQVLNGLYTLCCVCFGVGIFLTVATGIAFSVVYSERDESKTYREDADRVVRWFRRAITASLLGIMGMILVPTKQTFLFMVGGKAVDEAVTSNPEIKELPGNTLNLLNEYIKFETEKVKERQNK